jgi:hypothetical protein
MSDTLPENFPDNMFGFLEPESAANTDFQPVYPYNNVTRTNSGHYMEMDDTPERERVRLQHRTGTFVEMHPDGSQDNHIVGDSYHIVERNGYVTINGNCSVTINGDAQVVYNGNLTQRVVGDYNLEVGGNFDTKVNGSSTNVINRNYKLRTSITGSITLQSAYSVYVNADLSVNGAVRATFLHSNGGINAGGAIHSTLGISTLGGIIQGGIQAPPTGITAFGPVASAVSVTSIEIIDKTGPLSVFKTIYNSHIHPTPRGPSGTPISPVA